MNREALRRLREFGLAVVTLLVAPPDYWVEIVERGIIGRPDSDELREMIEVENALRCGG